MSFPRAFGLIAATLAATWGAACGSDAPEDPEATAGTGGGSAGATDAATDAGTGGSGGTAPIAQLPLEWLACEQDADCVVVQPKSCRACVTVATHVDHAEDTEDFYREVREKCPDITSAPCAPKPDVTLCVAGQCDFIVDCDVMERALMCTELGKCSALGGAPCHPGDGGDAFVRVGCFPRAETVSPGQTCGEDPDTGQQLVFISSEIPPGWTTCDLSECTL
jgi:hypothetical protein